MVIILQMTFSISPFLYDDCDIFAPIIFWGSDEPVLVYMDAKSGTEELPGHHRN